MVFNLCSCQFLQSLVPSRMADAEVPGQLRSAELWLSCLARGRAAILDLPGVHLPRKLLRTRNRWQSVAKSVAIRVRVCACKTSMDFNKGLPYQKCCDSHSTRKKQTPIIWASLKHISAKIGRHKRACIQGGRDWHVVEDHEHVWTEHHNEAATQPRKRDWIESSALQNPMSNKEGLNRIVKAEIMGNHGKIMGKSWGNHGEIMEVAEEAANSWQSFNLSGMWRNWDGSTPLRHSLNLPMLILACDHQQRSGTEVPLMCHAIDHDKL